MVRAWIGLYIGMPGRILFENVLSRLCIAFCPLAIQMI